MWKAPVGYLNGDETSLVRDTSKAPLVRQAFEWFATGRFLKREVLDKIAALGITSRHSKPLKSQSSGNILKNPGCCGRLVSPRWGFVGDGDGEPLVNVKTFNLVQALMSGKRGGCVGRRRRDHEDFPLRRFVRCAQCKEAVTGSWFKGKAGKRYAYYRCRESGCSHFIVSKDALETAFVELLESLRPKPGYLSLFREIVLDVWKQWRIEAGTLRRTLEGRAVSLHERID